MADRTMLLRAAAIYLDAGAPADAARCFAAAGEAPRAAAAYEEAGDYAAAVAQYVLAADPLNAGWLSVHCLADGAAARDMIRAMPEVPPPPSLQTWQSVQTARMNEHWSITNYNYNHNRKSGPPDDDGNAKYARLLVRMDELNAVQLNRSVTFEAAVEELIFLIRREKEQGIDDQDFNWAAAMRNLEKKYIAERGRLEKESENQRAVASVRLLRRLVIARCDAADGLSHAHILPALAEAQSLLSRHEWPVDRRVEAWGVAVAESASRYDQVALVFAAAVRGRRIGAQARWRDWARRVLHTELTLPEPSAAR